MRRADQERVVSVLHKSPERSLDLATVACLNNVDL
jgi:hypothetical protein